MGGFNESIEDKIEKKDYKYGYKESIYTKLNNYECDKYHKLNSHDKKKRNVQ